MKFSLDDSHGDGAEPEAVERRGGAHRGAHLALGQRHRRNPATSSGTSGVVKPGARDVKIVSTRWCRERRSLAAGDSPARAGRRACSATCRSTWPRANGSPCAVPTAAARPRCCAASRASRAGCRRGALGRRVHAPRLDARFARACSTRGTPPGIKDDLTAEENLQCCARAARRRVERAGDRGCARRRRPRQAPPAAGAAPVRGTAPAHRARAPRRSIPRRAGSSTSRSPRSTTRASALFGRLLERHLAAGGLAVMATHHDLAPAPARELRIGG